MKESGKRRYLPLIFAALAIALPAYLAAAWGPPLPAAAAARAETASGSCDTVHVEEWLILGPFKTPLPAFHNEGPGKVGPADLLEHGELNAGKLRPVEGKAQRYLYGEKGAWRKVSADAGGVVLKGRPAEHSTYYLATYMETDRWMKVSIEGLAAYPFEITIDGVSLVKYAGGAGPELESGREKGRAKIERGKHLLVVKTVYVPGETLRDWRIDVRISAEGEGCRLPALTLSPEERLSLDRLLEIPSISDIVLSPDGSLLAVLSQGFKKPGGEMEKRLEIRRFDDGRLVRTILGGREISDPSWSPSGRKLSYMVRSADKGKIRLVDLETGSEEWILEDIKNLDGYIWGPSGSFVVFSTTDKPKPDKSGVERLRGIRDRQKDARDRSYIYASSVPGGVTRRLTAGKHNTNIMDMHPDGGSLLITREHENLSGRPYGQTELVVLDLENQRTELLWKGSWLRSAKWSPDGAKILVLAGPSSFGDVGLNLPEGKIPNDYDVQAYIFDPESKTADPITKDFAPSVSEAHWPRRSGLIYLVAEERSFQRLYAYNPSKRSFRRIDIGCAYIKDAGIALDGSRAAVAGSSADKPPGIFAVDLKRGGSRVLHETAAAVLEYVQLGRVENWSFETGGKTIEGRIHYPPGFDAGKNYPCIVYYYGGTSPTGRYFGGRYPKNLWAAMGYVIYILHPSGATGFGQEFSALHVNDWGKIVADEIIEGVTKLLEAHSFIDGKRVGCIGASYGGFMTQLLVTRTDIFAAAVSHAGISSITSYWGEGYWGYAYNAVSAANSFPWNRPDIYIDQSPLFSADRISTPLLLLHGKSDTNVPPGESEQMYTALKLLGKEVEYVRFEGENHFILDYKKRKAWSNTIAAWFDRWLKREPGWWSDLYPPSAEAKPEEKEKYEPVSLGGRRIEKPDGRILLMGEITRRDIEENLPGWDEEYFTYTPEDAAVGELAARIGGTDILVVLGTWCGDSRREVPRLWRILEEAGFPEGSLRMLAVDRSSAEPDESTPAELIEWSGKVREFYDIEAVASIILFREGVEIGRIVETPAESLEMDLLNILD